MKCISYTITCMTGIGLTTKEIKNGFHLNSWAWCSCQRDHIWFVCGNRFFFSFLQLISFWQKRFQLIARIRCRKIVWSTWTWFFCFLRWNDYIFFCYVMFFWQIEILLTILCDLFGLFWRNFFFFESISSIIVEQWSSKLMILFC